MLGITELDLKITLQLGLSDIRNFQLLSHIHHQFINSNIFWKYKVDIDFDGMSKEKPDNETYYEQYRYLHSFRHDKRNVSEIFGKDSYRLDLLMIIQKRNGFGYFDILERLPARVLPLIIHSINNNIERASIRINLLSFNEDEDIELDPWETNMWETNTWETDTISKTNKNRYIDMWNCRFTPLPFNNKEDIEIYESFQIPFNTVDLLRAGQLSFDLLKILYPKIGWCENSKILECNNLEYIIWIEQQGVIFTDEDIKSSVSGKAVNYSIFHYFFEKGIGLTQDVLHYALMNRNVDIIKYLLKHSIIPSIYFVDHPIENEYYDCADILKLHGYIPSKNALFKVAEQGKVLAINWFIDSGFTINSEVMDYLCISNNIELLERFEIDGVLPSKDNMARSLKVLVWLEDKEIYASMRHASNAYLNNNLKVLVWLGKRGIFPDPELRKYYNRCRYYGSPYKTCRRRECDDDYCMFEIETEIGEWVENNRSEISREKQIELCQYFRAKRQYIRENGDITILNEEIEEDMSIYEYYQ